MDPALPLPKMPNQWMLRLNLRTHEMKMEKCLRLAEVNRAGQFANITAVAKPTTSVPASSTA